MTIRVCPACARRTSELIEPNCPVCEGTGVVELHPAAIQAYGAPAASEAVLVALEASARMLDTPGCANVHKVSELRARVRTLAAGRLIITWTGLEVKGPASSAAELPENPTPDDIAAFHGRDLPEAFDHVVALGLGYEYPANARPNSRGTPVLSASGHPSSLARVVDPADELGDTGALIRDRRTRAFQANALVQAVDDNTRRTSER